MLVFCNAYKCVQFFPIFIHQKTNQLHCRCLPVFCFSRSAELSQLCEIVELVVEILFIIMLGDQSQMDAMTKYITELLLFKVRGQALWNAPRRDLVYIQHFSSTAFTGCNDFYVYNNIRALNIYYKTFWGGLTAFYALLWLRHCKKRKKNNLLIGITQLSETIAANKVFM